MIQCYSRVNIFTLQLVKTHTGETMKRIDQKTLTLVRKEYPSGTRIELIKMNDPYNTTLIPGSKGTVVSVDDIGTIHVAWDCGSSLGVVYGEDICRVLNTNSKK